jgi:hypothetical protein
MTDFTSSEKELAQWLDESIERNWGSEEAGLNTWEQGLLLTARELENKMLDRMEVKEALFELFDVLEKKNQIKKYSDIKKKLRLD